MGVQIPGLGKTVFKCPHCQVVSTHTWSASAHNNAKGVNNRITAQGSLARHIQDHFDAVFSKCLNCMRWVVWYDDRIIWPERGSVPLPNDDLFEDGKKLYEEAASIVERSPAGACALLRLCLEKFCKDQLGRDDGRLYDMIGGLVEDGLSEKIQKAADSVRIQGNDAAHAGTVSLEDDRETARILFEMVNIIVEEMVSEPARVQELYDSLPENKLKGVEQRDQSQE